MKIVYNLGAWFPQLVPALLGQICWRYMDIHVPISNTLSQPCQIFKIVARKPNTTTTSGFHIEMDL